MPFCPKCGHKVEDDAWFCPGCGGSLSGNSAEKPAPSATSNKARIKFSRILDQYGRPTMRLVVINADTKEEICRTHGGEVITVDAPMNIGLNNLGLKKFVYKVEPGKKYEAKLVLGLLKNKFVINEIDVFDSD